MKKGTINLLIFYLFCSLMCFRTLEVSAAIAPIATSESYRSGVYYSRLLSTLDTYGSASQADRFVAVAMSQEGYKSNSSSDNVSGNGDGKSNSSYKTYCEYTNPQTIGHFGDDWCAAFISWSARMAGLPEEVIPTTAGAGTFRNVGTQHRLWSDNFSEYQDYRPQKGDIILSMPDEKINGEYYKYNAWTPTAHVAIVAKDSTVRAADGGWLITTIERTRINGLDTVGYLENLYSTAYTFDNTYHKGVHKFQMIVTPNWQDNRDTEPPVISNAKATNVTNQGFTVSCTVTDNVGVSRVRFPVWTPDTYAGGTNQDDLEWIEGTKGADGTTWSAKVYTSNHNNEVGCRYWTDIDAYDLSGNKTNYSSVTNTYVVANVPSKITPDPNTLSVSSGNCFEETLFTWTSAANADKYDLYIYNPDGSRTVHWGLKGNSFYALVPAGSYTAMVAPVNSTYSTWSNSNTVSFTVASAAAGNGGSLAAYREAGHKLYCVYDRTCSWLEAEAIAAGSPGTFASITSQAEQNAVAEAVAEYGHPCWLGAETYRNNTFKWVNGDSFTYTNWAAGEPSGGYGVEDCLEMVVNGTWNDHHAASTTGTDYYNVCGYVLQCEPISVMISPIIGEFDAGTPVTKDDLNVTVVFENGTMIETTDYSLNQSGTEPGDQTITVTYGNVSDTAAITLTDRTAVSLFIAPLVGTFDEGTVIEKEDLIVTVVYDNGEMEEITDYMLVQSGTDAGEQTITVTYKGLSDSIMIFLAAPFGIPDFSLPESLESIEEEAFTGGTMHVVECPDGLQSIGKRAFAECRNLEQILIPESVTAIGEDAFASDSNLVIYCYSGSEAQRYAEQESIRYILLSTAATPTVSFDAAGGTVSPGSKVVVQNEPLGELPIPVRTNYSFDGWYTAQQGGTRYTADTVCTEDSDFVLYAHWTANTVTVTFDANGGTTPVSSKTVQINQAMGSLPSPTRTYYSFAGWYTAANGGTKYTADSICTSSGNFRLYAHWTENGWGSWSGWSNSPVSAAYSGSLQTRQVETQTVPTYTTKTVYHYMRYIWKSQYATSYRSDGFGSGGEYQETTSDTEFTYHARYTWNGVNHYEYSGTKIDGCYYWYDPWTTTEQVQTGSVTQYRYRDRIQ